jgi:DNA-binding TFAR19-related protein (PDSD5 family)
MTPSEILRRVALVRTDVSEELSASIIRVARIGELGTTLAVISHSNIIELHRFEVHTALSSSC